MNFFKKLFVALTLLCAFACQKEYAPEPVTTSPSTGGGSTGGGSGGSSAKLSKIVIKDANTTVTRTYEYNSAGKLSICKETAVASGQTIISTYTFNRDNNNKVISFVIQYNITGYPPDGAKYTCHYPAGSSLFDYATASYAFAGTTKADSIVFGIALNLVTSATKFQDIANTGYQFSGKNVYTYDNSGNITENKSYNQSAVTGNLDLVTNTVYFWDTKVNALQLGQEALIMGGEIHIGKNNVTKQVQTEYATNPSGVTVTNSYAYTYNANSQPTTATATATNGATAVITYTYQ